MPYLVVGLQGIKVTMVACGDAFTVAIGAGEIEALVSCLAAVPGFLELLAKESVLLVSAPG